MSKEKELRQEIVEAGQRLYFKDLVAACDGNISARLSSTEILLTPSGVSKGFFSPDQILKIDYDGNILEGFSKPSREINFHIGIFKERPDVNGIVHAHPPLATAFGCTDRDFSRVLLPEVIFELGAIAVADYALPTTDRVTDSIIKVLNSRTNAILLSNHGAVTMGDSVLKAYYNMETLEAVAKITIASEQVGTPRYLTRPEVSEINNLMGEGSSPYSSETDTIETVVKEVVRRLMNER